MRASRMAAETGLELRVVPLPAGADPGELIAREGAEALRERVAGSVPFVVFEVDRILGGADLGSSEGKDRAIAALRPALAELPQSVLRDELTRRAAAALELTDARLVALLGPGVARAGAGPRDRGMQAPDPGPAVVTVRGSFEPAHRTEREFLAMCVAAPALGRPVLDTIDPDKLLTSSVLRRAAGHLAKQLDAPLLDLPRDDDEMSQAVAELVERSGRGGSVTADKLEHSRLLLELARVERQLNRARGERRPGIAVLAREKQDIKTRLEAVVSRLEQPH